VGELFLLYDFFLSLQHFFKSNCYTILNSPSSFFLSSILNSTNSDIKFVEFFHEYRSGFTKGYSKLVLTLRSRLPRYVFIRAKDFVTLLTKSILTRYTVCKIDVVSIYLYIFITM